MTSWRLESGQLVDRNLDPTAFPKQNPALGLVGAGKGVNPAEPL